MGTTLEPVEHSRRHSRQGKLPHVERGTKDLGPLLYLSALITATNLSARCSFGTHEVNMLYYHDPKVL